MQNLLQTTIFQGLKEVKMQKCLLWYVLFQKAAHPYIQLYRIVRKENDLCSTIFEIF